MKLIYRTRTPRKGFVFNETFMTHESKGYYDVMPDSETQRKAFNLVEAQLRKLTQELDDLGYDPTKVRFQIYFKD